MSASPTPVRTATRSHLHRLGRRLLGAVALTAVVPIAWAHVGAQRDDGKHRTAAVERPLPTVHVVAPDTVAQTIGNTAAVGGTWTQLSNLPPTSLDNCLLETDGTVMCHQNGGGNWYRLTPSNTGSYQAGTWAYDSTMQAGYVPLYFASAVLPDGHIIVEGGEYNNGSATWGTQGSLYDPVTHTWTAIAPPSGWTRIGDAQSVVLADGTFMIANCCSGQSALFNLTSHTWTAVKGAQADNYNDEEGWTLLPDRRVLTVDAWNGSASEIFDPVTQLWSSAGNTPVRLPDNNSASPSYELGPGVLRPDGTVFYFGANATGAGHTAIYNSTTGTWTAGPDLPNGDDVADGPAALLPNGNVLVQGSPGIFGSPSRWYEVDLATSSLSQVATPSYGFSPSSYYGEMLVLPTGQILQTEFSNDVRLYSPTGTYNGGWAPTITSVPATLAAGSTYVIQGTQFNGLSQGAAYGDDWQSSTNYPLVRITNTATGHVTYARTHDHSSMGVATGSTIVSTSFDVPAGAEAGASTVEVVANGIPSAARNVTVQSNSGPGAFAKTAPANAATGQSLTPTLTWGASSGATSYEYCIDTTNNAACDTSWVSAGALTSALPAALSAGTTYYWQVRASNGSTTLADSGTWWAFSTVTAPGVFNKSAPASGATGQTLTPTLSWAASSGATLYEYCVDTTNNAACDTSWVSTGTTRTATLATLAPATTYYWQVRSTNAAGTTLANAGTWWSFTTLSKPGAFTKSSPSNNSTGTSRTPTLSWAAASGATSYEYCVDTTNNSACDGTWVSTGTTRSVRLSSLIAATPYYWQVRARNSQGTTDATAGTWWKFTTR